MVRLARNQTIDAGSAAGHRHDRAQVAEWASCLEGAPPPAIVSWAFSTFGNGLVLASSFQDCVLVDVVARVAPPVEVVFLDTGFHFPETLAYVELVRRRYQLNLAVVGAELADDEWPCGTDRCCQLRKVEPLRRVLASRSAWMSGVRRVETNERGDTPVVEWDDRNDVVKVNPLVHWTDDDMARFEREERLPVHPLRGHGYRSIGCEPTTRPVAPEDHPRAGRWPGSERAECGLHA